MRTAGLIIAMLIQPAAGLISDRSTSRFGRRRPFITHWRLTRPGIPGSHWAFMELLVAARGSAADPILGEYIAWASAGIDPRHGARRPARPGFSSQSHLRAAADHPGRYQPSHL